MVEIVIKDYLESTFDVPVVFERPEDAPASFILLQKTGSSLENWIHTATFAIQSYGQTMLAAATLNDRVCSAMDIIAEHTCISRAQKEGDYNFTDTAEKAYRYQAVYTLTY